MTAPMTEQEFIRELAAEYAKQGFRAVTDPSNAALPDFLQGIKVDLLLSSPTENVIVQVKSRSAMRADRDLPRLAAALEGRPNWRLEFLMVPEPVADVPSSRTSFSADLAQATLKEARTLLDSGHHAAVLLLGWAVAEAVFRLRLGPDDADRVLAPRALISTMFSRGELGDEGYRLLRSIAEARNATAHGFQVPIPDSGTLQAFLTLVESLLPQ